MAKKFSKRNVSQLRYDSRVKAMEVDERPTEQYSDIGGLDTQIQEVYKVNNYNIYYNNIVYFTSFYSLRTEED